MKRSPNELEKLFNDAIDGLLTDDGEAALAAILRSDAEARRQYLRFMQLHAELHWDHGASAALLTEPHSQATGKSTTRHSLNGRRWGAAAALAALALTMGLVTLLRPGAEADHGLPIIAVVEAMQGAVSYRDPTGEQTLSPGDSRALPACTLIVEGVASAVQIRFPDGTLMTLSGDAEATIAAVPQKLLRVRRGLLTAEVQPQPKGWPMVVETPTARLEVLGTVFTLASEAERTRVSVDAGRVRLRRLVDGRTVDVPQEQSCVASLNAGDELRPLPPVEPRYGWHHAFTSAPPERWKGQWFAPDVDAPGRVRAVPCVVGRKDQAQPVVHFGVTARKADDFDMGRLPATGSLQMTYRLEQPSPLRIMLGVHRPDGTFGGNFEVKLSQSAAVADADGWRLLTVPLVEFAPLIQRYPSLKENARPYLILVTTFEKDAGLEVSELALASEEEAN